MEVVATRSDRVTIRPELRHKLERSLDWISALEGRITGLDTGRSPVTSSTRTTHHLMLVAWTGAEQQVHHGRSLAKRCVLHLGGRLSAAET
jgi:hypothetical protein